MFPFCEARARPDSSAAPSGKPLFWKRLWFKITALFTAIAIVVAFIADLSDVIHVTRDYLADDTLPPLVILTPVDISGHQCTQFRFSRLPEDFTLGRIQFQIIDAEGPAPFSGHMASEVLPLLVVRPELHIPPPYRPQTCPSNRPRASCVSSCAHELDAAAQASLPHRHRTLWRVWRHIARHRVHRDAPEVPLAQRAR